MGEPNLDYDDTLDEDAQAFAIQKLTVGEVNISSSPMVVSEEVALKEVVALARDICGTLVPAFYDWCEQYLIDYPPDTTISKLRKELDKAKHLWGAHYTRLRTIESRQNYNLCKIALCTLRYVESQSRVWLERIMYYSSLVSSQEIS